MRLATSFPEAIPRLVDLMLEHMCLRRFMLFAVSFFSFSFLPLLSLRMALIMQLKDDTIAQYGLAQTRDWWPHGKLHAMLA